jgi:hypothetical protein
MGDTPIHFDRASRKIAFRRWRSIVPIASTILLVCGERSRSWTSLVFSLGLTECWISCEDGAAYPICPGTGGGEFDARKYKFVNFDVAEVTDDLKQFVSLLRSVNQRARIILTVSPVPLVATAEDKHVLVATTYSKSVLRVAAEAVVRSCDDVTYFPSYEIITGSFSRGAYFAEDGAAAVVRLQLKQYFIRAVAPVDCRPLAETKSATRTRLD